MALGANTFLGFPKKPGVFSKLEFSDSFSSQTGTSAAISFSTVRAARGSDIQPLADGDSAVKFTGAVLETPGIYYIEGGYLYNGSNAVATITANQSLNEAIKTENIVSTFQLTTFAVPFGTMYIANAGDVIRIHSSANITGNSTGYLRITKVV